MPDSTSKIHLQKSVDTEGAVSSLSTAAALSRLKDRLPALRRRYKALGRVAMGGLVFALIGSAFSYFQAPSMGPLVWHHVLYPASVKALTSAAQSPASAALALSHFFDGPLGLSLTILTIVVLLTGMAMGIIRNSPMPMIAGAGMAISLHFGFSILLPMAFPSGMETQTPISVKTMTVPQLTHLQATNSSPKIRLALQWVIAQKEYFGASGPSFAQEVALLDKAHFAHDPNLPGSVTTARLLALSQAAHLPAEVAALQQEQTKAWHQQRQNERISADISKAGAGLALVLGVPAVLLRRRERRLQHKLETETPASG